MYGVGIDVGSVTTKAMIMKKEYGREISVLSHHIVPTMPDMRKSVEKVLDSILGRTGISREEIVITGTGYGKNIVNIEFAGSRVSEITCQARGVRYLFPKCRTIIDLGGQDSKVARLDEKGVIVDFDMNDKCAAGTGRFIENMCRVLCVDIAEFGEIAVQSKKKANITSTCTVFAESEVISLVSEGKSKEEIIAALAESIASRVAGLVKTVGVKEDVVTTGGVAKNIGVVKSLEHKLGCRICVPEEPLLTGAFGAALISCRRCS